MTITATPEPEAHPPRVRVNVSRGGATRTAQVVRVAADGGTVVVRAPIRLASGTGVVWDNEAPFGAPVRYRVIDGTGQETSAQATLDAGLPWLVHPFAPSLSVPVTGAAHGEPLTAFAADSWRETTRATSSSIADALNRDEPMTQRVGRRRARSSTMVLRTRTGPQWHAMDAIVDDDQALLLQIPAAAQERWGLGTCWVQLEEVTDARESTSRDRARLWTLPYRVVGRPEGEAAASWTWADVAATYATWADVETAYATWADLEADVRRVG